jgi:hypothetical protein
VKPWIRKGCFACVGVGALGLLIAFALGGTFLVQHFSENAEETRLAQEIGSSPAGAPSERPGSVVLSLSSASVTVKAGPAGGPIRVESDFDPEVYWLEQSYEEDGAGGWIYRVDFHEKTVLHVSVVGIWLGKRSPEVRITLPRDVRLALDAQMRGGYLSLDLAGLALTTASVELDRGVLGVVVSEPLPVPIERLSLKGRIGTMQLLSLGNASPRELHVQHGLGAALVDLGGMWAADADVDFRAAMGNIELRLPRGVNIEGLDGNVLRLVNTDDEEIPPPTLRISTDSDFANIRVID